MNLRGQAAPVGLAAVGVVVLGVGLLAGSGGFDDTEQPVQLLGGGPKELEGGPARTAALGELRTLRSRQKGSRMHVRVVDIEDPLQGGARDLAPRGTRYVGVRVRLSNAGRVPYNDSLSNSTTLETTGPPAEAAFLGDGPCPDDFGAQASIPAGKRAEGCLAYAVREGERPTALRYTLEAGFGPATGAWRLGSRP